MRAFHGDARVKRDLRDRVTAHIEAGTMLLGDTSWDGSGGSPLGVSAEATDAQAYADAFGYPLPLAALLDPLSAALGEDERGFRFVLDWVSLVEPGADLSQVPARLVLMMLETAGTGSALKPLQERLIALHRRDLANDPVDRAEWSALRQAIAGTKADAADNPLAFGGLGLFEAACWPAGRGYTPLSATFSACLVVVGSQADPAWGEADNRQVQDFFDALQEELQPRLEAGEPVDFMAIFQERRPELAERFMAYDNRYQSSLRERSMAIAAACLDCFRQAPVCAAALPVG